MFIPFILGIVFILYYVGGEIFKSFDPPKKNINMYRKNEYFNKREIVSLEKFTF